MRTRSTYLTAIGYVTGSPRPISDLPQCRDDVRSRETLAAEGYSMFLEAGESAEELALASIEESLRATSIPPSAVDAVIFCSDSIGDQRERERNSRIHALCMAMGLTNAYPIGISQSTCGNFATAMRVGSSLLATGDAKVVMLTVADKSEPDKRIMDANAAVLSDGAASCILSERPGRYLVCGVSQSVSHELATTEDKSARLFLALDGYQSALAKFQRTLEWNVSDAAQLLPNNYTRSLLTTYAQIAELPLERMYMDNVPLKGHVFSADNLINLHDYAAGDRMVPGQSVAMLSNGPSNWGFVALQRTEIE